MMTLQRLEEIANSVINKPWGCGDPYLAQNSESWAPYLRFLNAVVSEYKPEVVVECGVYLGTATEHMAIANENTMVIGIDREFQQNAFLVADRHKNVHLVDGDTVGSAETVKLIIGDHKIGLIFLDSTHDGDTPKREFITYQPMFADECLVVVDDLIGPYHLAIVMQLFWHWLPGEKVELDFLHPKVSESQHDTPGFGISIVRK